VVLRSDTPSIGTQAREIAISLKTADKRVAVKLAFCISSDINLLLPRVAAAMRDDHGANEMFDDVRRFLRDLVGRVRANGGADDSGTDPDGTADPAAMQLLAREFMRQLLTQVALPNPAADPGSSATPDPQQRPAHAVALRQPGTPHVIDVQPAFVAESLGERIEMWIDSEGVAWAAETKLDYRNISRRFARFAQRHGIHGMDQVTPQSIDVYKRLLLKEGSALRSVNKHLSALASWFKWAMKAGYCRLNKSPVTDQFYAKSKIRKVSLKRLIFTDNVRP
jgi:hypothetical protein